MLQRERGPTAVGSHKVPFEIVNVDQFDSARWEILLVADLAMIAISELLKPG